MADPLIAKEREARTAARRKIIQAANAYRLRLHRAAPTPRPPLRLLSARHIQQAVCIVRRRRLVKPEVLVTAGFRGLDRG